MTRKFTGEEIKDAARIYTEVSIDIMNTICPEYIRFYLEPKPQPELPEQQSPSSSLQEKIPP